jgi:hypothetical protein
MYRESRKTSCRSQTARAPGAARRAARHARRAAARAPWLTLPLCPGDPRPAPLGIGTRRFCQQAAGDRDRRAVVWRAAAQWGWLLVPGGQARAFRVTGKGRALPFPPRLSCPPLKVLQCPLLHCNPRQFINHRIVQLLVTLQQDFYLVRSGVEIALVLLYESRSREV